MSDTCVTFTVTLPDFDAGSLDIMRARRSPVCTACSRPRGVRMRFSSALYVCASEGASEGASEERGGERGGQEGWGG
jgi:hypothetical protein